MKKYNITLNVTIFGENKIVDGALLGSIFLNLKQSFWDKVGTPYV